MAKKEDLIKIVDAANISDDPETLDAYSKDQSFVSPRKPRLVAKPENVDQVQKIVKWANETNTPLVPVSSGPPHFHGDTVPSTGGAVIVDLGRMRKIIRIDRKNRMILIEPGVTYGELQPLLVEKGLRLSTPLLPRRDKSVIASLLEREPIMVPKYHWTLLEPLRCLEIVWGNGDKLWTGEAGTYPNSLEKQWEMKIAQVDPMGPAQTDFYRLVSAAQGSMGIVTWASIKCEILPTLHKLFFVPSAKPNDLINCAYKLLRIRLGDEFMLLNGSNLACILGKGDDQIRVLKGELPNWVMILGLAGRAVFPEERVALQEKAIRDILQQCHLELTSAIPGTRDEEMLEAILNPSKAPYWKLGYKGGCQDIFFLTTLNRAPELVNTMYSAAETLGYPSSDIGIYIQPQQQGVSCHCEFSLPYNPDNQTEVARVKELLTKTSKTLMNQGAFFSRPYGQWADMVYSRDAQSTILLKKVKGIFDPNNVMNPGKLCF